jgi:hypothetical protein
LPHHLCGNLGLCLRLRHDLIDLHCHLPVEC